MSPADMLDGWLTSSLLRRMRSCISPSPRLAVCVTGCNFPLTPLRLYSTWESSSVPVSIDITHVRPMSATLHDTTFTFKKTLLLQFLNSLCFQSPQREHFETDHVYSYNMGFQAFYCSSPLFYLSSLSTYSPCPLSNYLPITSSSCGLLVTIETSRFALLLSTLVHIFSPCFPLSLWGLDIFKTCMLMCVWFVFMIVAHIGWRGGQGSCGVLCVHVCSQHWGSLTDTHSDNIVHCCTFECFLFKTMHSKVSGGVAYKCYPPFCSLALLCGCAVLCKWSSMGAFVLAPCKNTFIYRIWFMITTSSPGATSINCSTMWFAYNTSEAPYIVYYHICSLSAHIRHLLL